MVVLEHPTKPFTAFDSASDRTRMAIRLNEFITEHLMIPLAVIVLDVLLPDVLK
jgi:hypothetical protein